MKIIAWNVNSLRSIIKHDYLNKLLLNENPDILCLSETKLSDLDIDDYFKNNYEQYKYRYWHNSKIKLGYSGTAIFMKKKPIKVIFGLNDIDNEGRVITIQINKNLWLLHLYNINAGIGLSRLNYKITVWNKILSEYINELLKLTKKLIICGDLNVAHKIIDIKNSKSNIKSAGFTIEERDAFTELLLKYNLIDTFRLLYPETIKYTYWSYKNKAREKNVGWRLDYFLINNLKSFINKIKNCNILDTYYGSDHCPIILELK
jgi:exodeoxyribonuclease III